MSRFLTLVPVEKAVSVALSLAPPPEEEKVLLGEAYGRILSRITCSDISIPGFDRSTVDGYAVVAADTTGAGEGIPAILHCVGKARMGEVFSGAVTPDTCVYVPTGAMLPAGADAVVMIEYCEAAGETLLVKRPVAPGENVLRLGEDFPKGAPVLKAGTKIGPQEMGVLAATGSYEVHVWKRPVIGIISSGNEVIPVERVPGPGQVRDANSHLSAGFVLACGCIPDLLGISMDDASSLGPMIRHGVERCDALLVSGGSSKDDRDFTARMISEVGEVLVHGIAIAPGKPTIIGRAGPVPIIGLPGHPASAFVVLHAIAGPLLHAMAGMSSLPRTTRPGILAANIPSARGREDYVRVRVEESQVFPVFGKSGLLNTLVQSDGLLRIPSSAEGLEAGEAVEVFLW